MNRSILDSAGPDSAGHDSAGQILIVSQFTLCGDTKNGRRPGFAGAAPPELARELYEYFAAKIRASGLVTCLGIFQAHMEVELVNDGPVTFLLES